MKNKFLLSLKWFLNRINPFKTPGQVFVIDPTAGRVVFKILKPIELYYAETVAEEGAEPRVRPVVVESTNNGTVALSLVDGFYNGVVNFRTITENLVVEDSQTQKKTVTGKYEVGVFLSPPKLADYVNRKLVEVVGLKY